MIVGPRECDRLVAGDPTNQVRAILEGLAQAGIPGIARRERTCGSTTGWALSGRPLGDPGPEPDQRLHRLLSRYRGGGLLGSGGQAELWIGTGPGGKERSELRQKLVEDGSLLPVTVEGFKADRFIVGAELPILRQAEREVAAGEPPGGVDPGVAFLAPLDPFVWDRDQLRRLFDFDYIWEVYVPAAKRRWGYYVLESCMATGSWGVSSRASNDEPGRSTSSASGGRMASIPVPIRGSRRPSPRRSPRIAISAGCRGFACRGRRAIDPS